MTEPTLVCPLTPTLHEGLRGCHVVLTVDNPPLVSDAVRLAAERGIPIQCVWVRTTKALDEVVPSEQWGATPVALQVAGLGSLRGFLAVARDFSQYNVRFYLPAETRMQCKDLQILASLGFHCCALISARGSSSVDWRALTDLAVYSMYSPHPHGEIDPFSYLVRTYDGRVAGDLRAVYFDDPSQFLHADEQGRLAINQVTLLRGSFLGVSIGEQGRVAESSVYREAVNLWRDFFVSPTACGQCRGWRVCHGVFSDRGAERGCQELFGEVLEGAEHFHRLQQERRAIWQPSS